MPIFSKMKVKCQVVSNFFYITNLRIHLEFSFLTLQTLWKVLPTAGKSLTLCRSSENYGSGAPGTCYDRSLRLFQHCGWPCLLHFLSLTIIQRLKIMTKANTFNNKKFCCNFKYPCVWVSWDYPLLSGLLVLSQEGPFFSLHRCLSSMH